MALVLKEAKLWRRLRRRCALASEHLPCNTEQSLQATGVADD